MVRRKIAQGVKKWAFLLVGVIGLLLASFGAARAVFYPSISTTDSTNADWAGIGVFMTDLDGDVTNPDEDWINGWVSQTGNSEADKFHFLMEVLGPGVLIEEERAAAALLDCNQDGVMTQNDDAVIAYDWFNGSVPEGWDDMVIVCDGALELCLATGDRDLGQKFSITEGEDTRYFVEWGIPFANIPPVSQSGLDTQNCKDLFPSEDPDKLIDIKFQTAISTYQAPDTIDDSDFFSGYNDTTVIDLNTFNAETRSWNSLPLLLAGGVMVLVGFGGYIVIRRSKQ